MTIIAQDAAKIYNIFKLTEKEENDIEIIKEKFYACFSPKAYLTYERYIFNKMVQVEGQSPFDEFPTAIINQGKKCEFQELSDGLLCDKIVVGINSDTVQERLLAEGKLTFNQAVKICRATELTKQQLNSMKADSSLNLDAACKKNGRKEHMTAATFQCFRCGTSRQRRSCPAFFVKGFKKCGKLGHFAVACRSQRVMTSANLLQHYVKTLTLHRNYRVKIKLDTGAQCNVLSTSVASKCGFVYDIDLVDQPNFIMYAPRKVPYCIRDAVKHELDTMVANDTIELITEPTSAVSPMVVVHKNGKGGICIDPSDINNNLKRKHFPRQITEEISTRLHCLKYFTLLDCTKAFWQVKVS
ncbi:hypothetical protein PR048_015920 [Dryococelus australis]|uniref:Uncharacterized protein n=1 Tax=Dryococelus australis TaxID=614101 RepID=A0ABQ9HJE6_9NEOP|nr:hypothetical protein PR048_015920 [Dryococelus australis]